MAFKKCRFCSESEVPERADFCIWCGRSREGETIQETVIDEPNPPPPPPSNAAVIAIIGCVLVVVVHFIAIFMWRAPVNSTDTNSTNENNEERVRQLIANELRRGWDSNNWTKEERAERKKRGVTVGMSKDEVLGSSWGKPKEINTTTTWSGTSEQWVYSGRNYLYFDGDILTSIQN